MRFFRRTTNLHKDWDSGITQKTGLAERAYAKQLERWLDEHNTAGLQAGTTVDWALESHRAAAEHAYHIPASRKLASAYYDENEPVVDEQLAKAGLRLARILNEVLR